MIKCLDQSPGIFIVTLAAPFVFPPCDVISCFIRHMSFALLFLILAATITPSIVLVRIVVE